MLNHNHIGTEHILLALTEDALGGAAEVLARFGTDPTNIRRQVTLRIRQSASNRASKPGA